MIHDALKGTYHLSDMQALGRQPFNTLAYVLTDPEATYEEPGHLKIKYVSGQHTAAPVPWAAIGPGSEDIPKGMTDNTAFFVIMARALGVSHEKPGHETGRSPGTDDRIGADSISTRKTNLPE